MCWAYLVQTASSSAARVWGTGRCSSSPVPGCSRVCRSCQSYRRDKPPTPRCSTQAGHSHRLTFCIHFLPVSTVGWKYISGDLVRISARYFNDCVFMWYFITCSTSSSLWNSHLRMCWVTRKRQCITICFLLLLSDWWFNVVLRVTISCRYFNAHSCQPAAGCVCMINLSVSCTLCPLTVGLLAMLAAWLWQCRCVTQSVHHLSSSFIPRGWTLPNVVLVLAC